MLFFYFLKKKFKGQILINRRKLSNGVNWGEKGSPALESETAAPRRDGRGRTGLSSRGNRWFYLARRRLLRLSHPFGMIYPILIFPHGSPFLLILYYFYLLITCLLGNATQCTNLGDTLSCVHCKKEKKSSSRLEKTRTVHANLVYIDDDDAWCIQGFLSRLKMVRKPRLPV